MDLGGVSIWRGHACIASSPHNAQSVCFLSLMMFKIVHTSRLFCRRDSPYLSLFRFTILAWMKPSDTLSNVIAGYSADEETQLGQQKCAPATATELRAQCCQRQFTQRLRQHLSWSCNLGQASRSRLRNGQYADRREVARSAHF